MQTTAKEGRGIGPSGHLQEASIFHYSSMFCRCPLWAMHKCKNYVLFFKEVGVFFTRISSLDGIKSRNFSAI